MEFLQGIELFRANPERYATTGLDWGNAAHYPDMAHNLQQALTGILGEMQVCRDAVRKNELRDQLTRVDARLSVLERRSWRTGVQLPADARDTVCRLALEKMADALEEAAAAWVQAEATDGRRVLVGAMLEIGVRFAVTAQREGMLARYVKGPHAGLAALAEFVANGQDCLEMADTSTLSALVGLARSIPSMEQLEGDSKAEVALLKTIGELKQVLENRAARADTRLM